MKGDIRHPTLHRVIKSRDRMIKTRDRVINKPKRHKARD